MKHVTVNHNGLSHIPFESAITAFDDSGAVHSNRINSKLQKENEKEGEGDPGNCRNWSGTANIYKTGVSLASAVWAATLNFSLFWEMLCWAFDLFEEEFPDLPLRGLGDKVHTECAFFIHQCSQLPHRTAWTNVVLPGSKIKHSIWWPQALREQE